MKYKLRDDVILEKIDNIYILVALRSAWKECPFAMQTAPSLAYIWEMIKQGKTEEDIIEGLKADKNMDQKLAEKNYRFFIRQSLKLHYLTEENDPC